MVNKSLINAKIRIAMISQRIIVIKLTFNSKYLIDVLI